MKYNNMTDKTIKQCRAEIYDLFRTVANRHMSDAEHDCLRASLLDYVAVVVNIIPADEHARYVYTCDRCSQQRTGVDAKTQRRFIRRTGARKMIVKKIINGEIIEITK
jgi:hypothetical protein